MKACRSPFLRSMRHFLTLALVCLPTTSMAATTAYWNTTEELDLSRVRLVVVASTELQEALQNRTLALFKSAGLSPPDSGSSQVPRLATLTLTLNPQPLTDICPGKVLYAPSLALTEPVTIQRTNAVIQDSTWLFGTTWQVREPMTAEQIETDLDGLINQFIADYKAANPLGRSQDKPVTPDVGDSQRQPLAPDLDDRPGDRSIHAIPAVNLSVVAERWSSALKAVAVRQLAEAGLRLVPDAAEDGAVSLSLELTQRALGDHCPGKVLYERGLYLVEEVRITRRLRVLLWIDTWLQESVQIVPPLSRQGLESDQRLLLQDFIRTHHTQ
jgi:hypothetical protein